MTTSSQPKTPEKQVLDQIEQDLIISEIESDIDYSPMPTGLILRRIKKDPD